MSCGTCKKFARGVIGLTKTAAGIDIADDATIKMRRDICRQCEFAQRNPNPKFAENNGLTTFSRCEKCTCFIAAKTKLKKEKCPIARWDLIG